MYMRVTTYQLLLYSMKRYAEQCTLQSYLLVSADFGC